MLKNKDLLSWCCVVWQVLASLRFSLPPPDGAQAPALHQVSVCTRPFRASHLSLQEQVCKVCVCVSGRTDRGWVCDCSARRSSALYFGLNSGSLILEFIKHVRLCVSKGPMRTSTGSLVQSWCVAMVMCLAVCPRRRRRHLQRESNRHLSSSSDTCWIQRLRWRASSTNTGGRCLIHTSMQKHHKATMQSLPLIFHLSQFVP